MDEVSWWRDAAPGLSCRGSKSLLRRSRSIRRLCGEGPLHSLRAGPESLERTCRGYGLCACNDSADRQIRQREHADFGAVGLHNMTWIQRALL